MIKKIIDPTFDNSRIDKYIRRLLPGMPSGLMYKQFRNKNITLNGSKIKGNEIISAGDEVVFFLSDETFKTFYKGESACDAKNDSSVRDRSERIYEEALAAYKSLSSPLDLIYENEHLLIMNKPSGILTQRSKSGEISLNEYMLGYLIDTGFTDKDSLLHFKPSVLNRLDRNTSGIVLGSKSLKAANIISKALKERTLHKLYRAVVWGEYTGSDEILTAYLKKDSLTNSVNILDPSMSDENTRDYDIIKTGIRLIETRDHALGKLSALDIELITGKTHQIRAHLSSLGYPIVGDPKYGDSLKDKKLGIKGQLLHAYRIAFDESVVEALSLDSNVYTTDIPFSLKDIS